MKYWRGYLVAAIVAAATWALKEFAESHWQLIDMVYPYVSRMGQDFLAAWSSNVSFCLWQALGLFAVAALLTTVVLMIVLHWNPIQWLGWVLATVSLFFLLNTGLYGLNTYAAPLAEDVRLNVSEYAITELQGAALYFRDMANKTAPSAEAPHSSDFDELALAAGEGFENLTQKEFLSVFAGSTVPVKKLDKDGVTGVHYPLTGEAAVNPKVPAAGLPFAMCEQMARRMCIANDQDVILAAFLACRANSRVEFQYSAYFMAYRYCLNSLSGYEDPEIIVAVTQLQAGESAQLKQDLETYASSFAVKADKPYADAPKGEGAPVRSNVTDLLVSVYIQEIVLPQQMEEEKVFDPMDETQVDLSGLPNAKVPANG
ncbi:MAG: DUF3810 family protein [Oscillospiraceae bacterium]|nr:DUF3810 family protein [Oscillospiraceae bacterium]MBQ7341522.1 DUF3810 family protein [Oscillospiraceae bacterium]